MKNRVFAIALMFCLVAGSFTMAQEPKRQMNGKERPSNEQIARRKTDRMAKELQLDPKQTEAVYELNLNRLKAQELRSEEVRQGREAESVEMKKILSEDQYKQWTELQRPNRPMQSRHPRTLSQENGKQDAKMKSNGSRPKMEKE